MAVLLAYAEMNLRRRNKARFLTLLLCVALPTSAAGHHGFRRYDDSRLLDVSGTIRSVKFTNPHVAIKFEPGPGQGTTLDGSTLDGATLDVLLPPPWSMISRELREQDLTPRLLRPDGLRHQPFVSSETCMYCSGGMQCGAISSDDL